MLKPLIAADACLIAADSEKSCLPARIENLLSNGKKLPICKELSRKHLRNVDSVIDKESLKQYEHLLDQFFETRSVLHLLRGHLVFGLLRHAISSALRKRKKRKTPDDASLYALFGGAVWKYGTHSDHRCLVQKLKKASSEAIEMRAKIAK